MIRITRQIGIVSLTLLAVALGGSVDLLPQTILAAAAGLLLLIAPPRAAIPRIPLMIAGGLLVLALAAFLPALSVPPWRRYLGMDAHVSLAYTRTPQPWLTAQACGLLFVGLVWALFLLTQRWDREGRGRAAQGLVFGVAILSTLAVAAFIGQFHIPGWVQEQNRGWFPNRNQTADVLALVGVVNYALIFDRLRRGQMVGWLLLVALVPIVTELVISYSRAGILLFFAGLLLWHLWPRPGDRGGGGSEKWLALSAGLTIALVAIFLTWGGATLNRFIGEDHSGGSLLDFRFPIQEDALRFSTQSPFLGVGLGNFEPLFSFSRVEAINENRAIHPESDWLWVACEMGWLAPILLVGAFIWWVRRCVPLERKPGESLRLAMIIGLIIFTVHAFVDVSGHRVGSLWVALLIAGLALPARENVGRSSLTPVFFRALGVLLLIVAAWWGASLVRLGGPPTTATLLQLKGDLAGTTLSAETVEKKSAEALAIAPLDWSVYLRLGAAEAFQPGASARAAADFRTARALNPYFIGLLMQEGQIWLAVNQPDLCLDTWRDGLKRAGPLVPEAFRQMVAASSPHSIMREGLAEMAFNRLDFLLMMLPSSYPDEADALLSHLVQGDPTLSRLTDPERTQLFQAWWANGNQTRMMELVRQHPEWEHDTWIYEAQFDAKEDDYQKACSIAAKWAQRPLVPQSASEQPVAQLQSAFDSDRTDLSAGLELLFAQIKASDPNALHTLSTLLRLPDHPHYLTYLAAQMESDKQNWQVAWLAWKVYLGL